MESSYIKYYLAYFVTTKLPESASTSNSVIFYLAYFVTAKLYETYLPSDNLTFYYFSLIIKLLNFYIRVWSVSIIA